MAAAATATATPSDDRKPSSTPQPVVLHQSDIDALPVQGFPEPGRIAGGFQTVFARETTGTDSLTFGVARFPARTAQRTSFEALHRHAPAEFYHVLAGQMVIFLEGVRHRVAAGAAVYIPGGAEHGFCNPSEAEDLVFSWGFATDGFAGIEYRWSDVQPDWAMVE